MPESCSTSSRYLASASRSSRSALRRAVTSRKLQTLPTRIAVDQLRLRVALEDAAVLELEHVEALGMRAAVQLLDLGEEPIGIDELVEHEGQRLVIVARLDDRLRNAPHVDELLVVAGHLAARVHHQQAVGGRICGRLVQRNRPDQPLLRPPTLTDVLKLADQEAWPAILAEDQRGHHLDPVQLAVGMHAAGARPRPSRRRRRPASRSGRQSRIARARWQGQADPSPATARASTRSSRRTPR